MLLLMTGSAAGPGAASDHEGRRPLAVRPYKVNWLTTKTGAPVVSTEVSPSKMRSYAILRAMVAILFSSTAGSLSPASISSFETPTRADSPPVSGASKLPTTSSSTVTEAERQRVKTARMKKRLLRKCAVNDCGENV